MNSARKITILARAFIVAGLFAMVELWAGGALGQPAPSGMRFNNPPVTPGNCVTVGSATAVHDSGAPCAASGVQFNNPVTIGDCIIATDSSHINDTGLSCGWLATLTAAIVASDGAQLLAAIVSSPLTFNTGTHTLACATCLTGNQTVTLSGDVAGSGATAITTTLANTAVTPASYTCSNLTVDAKGRLTAASNGACGTGTVTAVSVASANGFAGSSSGGATPALTLTTTVTGALKGNGTALSAAACADLSNGATGCSTATGTSGATLPLNNSNNAFSGNNSFSGTSTFTGSIKAPIRTVTAAGAITVSATTDYFICVNKASGAATVVNLPASPGTGLTYVVKDCKGDAATNNITITPNAGNIDNAGTYVISTNLASVAVVYDGTAWWVN